MVRNKVDNRIKILIENGVKLQHRTLFVIVGDKGKNQVVNLHHILAKAEVKSRPSVLWCHKNELGFNSNRKKRIKHLQHKKQAGKVTEDEDNPFELFITSTKIRYCYYSQTHRILGNTYGMCVLQDFEALTPNLLARTIETVEGGGVIVILLRSLNSLKQLYTMTMDVHQKFRTKAHNDVVCRFNERFLLSLADCKRCLVVDDQLSVLPISSHNLNVTALQTCSELSQNESELNYLKSEVKDVQYVSNLINCCKTVDQANALLKFIDAITEKTVTSIVSLTSARGRGKSAAMGLAVAAAVAFNYINILVTSPSPENLDTFFEFVFKGFDALEYQEHKDYEIIQSTNPEFNKAVVRINISRDHRQTIQYIHPTDSQMLSSETELLFIDEAAAIPLPYVKSMLGPYLVFLSSTINGYEGTGRSLSLKLLQQLRTKSVPSGVNRNAANMKDLSASIGRALHEVTLEESIRYKSGDPVELWLTTLLCLDSTSIASIKSGFPVPENCDLYYINRDTLFCYHKESEEFLHRMVSLCVASHYKNTPNDLQMMSDAPAHHLFCLLGPISSNTKKLPEILVIIQVCMEGQISERSALEGLSRGKQASGDLISWTVAQTFSEPKFAKLSGMRIVRIATHPDYQGMGYGSRALFLLKQYYEFKIPSIDENVIDIQEQMKNVMDIQEETENVDASEVGLLVERIEPRKTLPPLLLKLSERTPERLDYLGVSYGLTEPLLKFWKRAGFIPVFLGREANDLTGEYSCIMLNVINADEHEEDHWLTSFCEQFREKFVARLSSYYKKFLPSLALSVLMNDSKKIPKTRISKVELDIYFKPYHLKQMENYSKNLLDANSISDMFQIAKIYFLNKMGDVELSELQAAIILGIGLQHKPFDVLAKEIELPTSQLMGLFNRAIRRVVKYFTSILEEEIEKTLAPREDVIMNPVAKSMKDELEEAAKYLQKQQKKALETLKIENLSQYAIKGSEEEWGKILSSTGKKTLISVKIGEKRLNENSNETMEMDIDKQVDKKTKKKKKFHLS